MGFDRLNKVTTRYHATPSSSWLALLSTSIQRFSWPNMNFRGILSRDSDHMLDPVASPPKPVGRLLMPPRQKTDQPRQRRLMFGALLLLLIALAAVLYADRGFWFPDDPDAEDEPARALPAQPSDNREAASATATRQPRSKKMHSTRFDSGEDVAAKTPIPPPITVSERTVLPPLEVEVVAGDIHRRVRPGTNSLQVDLQPDPGSQLHIHEKSAAAVTSDAAERVEMSASSSAVVNRTVKPSYPVLARQMKVQGSVILQALIGRDGLIQNLHVVSGPPILAGAAQEAVKQWHFKPHYEGTQAVETQAKITVNFTISTN